MKSPLKNNRSTIYALLDPRSPAIIRYVGSTVRSLPSRLNQHIGEARAFLEQGDHARHRSEKTRWLSTLLEENIKPEIKVLEVVPHNRAAERESYWLYKSEGPALTNRQKSATAQRTALCLLLDKTTAEQVKIAAKKYAQNQQQFLRWAVELGLENAPNTFDTGENPKPKNAKRMFLWLTEHQYKLLQQLANERGQRAQALAIEAVDAILWANGFLGKNRRPI